MDNGHIMFHSNINRRTDIELIVLFFSSMFSFCFNFVCLFLGDNKKRGVYFLGQGKPKRENERILFKLGFPHARWVLKTTVYMSLAIKY